MFQRKLRIEIVGVDGGVSPCPIKGLDSFAMRNFTNDAVFDDTLPVGDGVMEAGHRVPLERLQAAMEDWLRRKGFVKTGEELRVTKISRTEQE
ncbi:MAG TPA: hypothetical protein VFC39_20120 [Acidobacteriaceae bacterium]|nr:hypothetical protein [Acidobacteriaceae bacterium]